MAEADRVETAGEESRYRRLLSLSAADAASTDALLEGLYDEAWRVRKAAIEGLTRTPHVERAVSGLIRVLGDRGQTGARNAAAEALVRLGRWAESAVIGLLQHPEADQRKFAADILAQMKSAQAVPALVASLDDGDSNVRASAAEALGSIGGEEAARALERVLKTGEPLLKLCALDALIAWRRPPPLPAVVPLLDDLYLRKSAYRVLGLVSQPAAFELICRGLSSEHRPVREAALAALGLQRMGGEGARRIELESLVRTTLRRLPDARELLVHALGADDLEVRRGALFAARALHDPTLAPEVAEVAREGRLLLEVVQTLSMLGPGAGKELLSRMGSLSGPAISAAAEALVELSHPSLVEPLEALLSSGEPELVAAAVRALGRSQSARAIELLTPVLDDAELAPAAARALVTLAETYRACVLASLEHAVAKRPTPATLLALAKVGGSSALPALRRTVRDADPMLRAASAEAACEIGGEDSVELVRLALADESAPVRRAAAKGLGRLKAADAAPLFRVALADEDASVQLAAIEAAGDAGAVEVADLLTAWVGDADGLKALRAVRALARLGRLGPDALERAARHADAEVVKEALASGATDPKGVELALAALLHARWDVRAAAARVLGASGGAECVPLLRDSLDREADTLAKEAMLEALSQLLAR